jgi:hypothetical protein
MEKFVNRPPHNRVMRNKRRITRLWEGYLILSLFLSGCASVQSPGYIGKVDHPYDRKIYAGFEKVTSALVYVLKKKGWVITDEAEPSIYERDDRYDNNNYQNLLIITDFKRKYRVLYSTFTHLNVLIHSFGNTSDVEIRYEARTPLIKQFVSARNDQLVQGILDALEQEVDR